jgi:hypothetical protein
MRFTLVGSSMLFAVGLFLASARFEWCAKRNCKLTQLNFFLNLGGHPLKLRENKAIDSYAYESFQGYDAPE